MSSIQRFNDSTIQQPDDSTVQRACDRSPFPTFESWGRFPPARHLGWAEPRDFEEARGCLRSLPYPVLPRGLGRSYGDSCLNDGGRLLLTSRMTGLLALDEESGILRCAAGTTLDQLLQELVPRGWFLPVVPGTRCVTVGGAIANDIHGKNHHRAGSFGRHVTRLGLLRSDGTRLVCSPEENPEWFRATVGGLGLTGCILWAELRLKPIPGPFIEVDIQPFDNLTDCASLSRESTQTHEYTVTWVDCLADRRRSRRGILLRGNHSPQREVEGHGGLHATPRWKSVPFDMPEFLLCETTGRWFNRVHFLRQAAARGVAVQRYDRFFFPLDAVGRWNRLYGRRGFLQWQCVIPFSAGYDAVEQIFRELERARPAPLLAVVKEFGDPPSVGMLSFPMPGITLSLDFANAGEALFRLLDRLDAVLGETGGRLYPAKDARMSPETFRRSFPGLWEFERYRDPKLSSSFYRRVRPSTR